MTHWIDTNLAFEYELANRPTAAIARFNAPWSHLLRLLDGFETAEILRTDSKIKNTDKLRVWGPTRFHRQLFPNIWPDLSAVLNANDKSWAFANAPEDQLSGAKLISTSTTKVQLHRDTINFKKWILKDPFGVSGRERFNGPTDDLEKALHWLSRRTMLSHVILEPFIAIAFEFSVHYEITQKGLIKPKGESAILCDTNGTYRGNYPIPKSKENIVRDAKNKHHVILNKLITLGYFGPISIDAYTGTYEGKPLLRAISEINARYTFGRIFLELCRRLGRTDFVWWHPSPKLKKKILTFPLEFNALVFPLESKLDKTGTLLIAPVEDALLEIQTRTQKDRP